MEEWVGQIWHKMVSRAADSDYQQAAVRLEEVRQSVAMMFRALGGEKGLRIESATETRHGARRSFLQRIAGSGQQIELAWCDRESLRLPSRIACFSQIELNRQLYLWLAALAAHSHPLSAGDWLQKNSAASALLLQQYPGLNKRYQQLLAEHLKQRPPWQSMKPAEAAQEKAIRAALQDPAAVMQALPQSPRSPYPVPLWLHPSPPGMSDATQALPDEEEGDDEQGSQHSEKLDSEKRRRGERVDMPDGRDGLLAFRLESFFHAQNMSRWIAPQKKMKTRMLNPRWKIWMYSAWRVIAGKPHPGCALIWTCRRNRMMICIWVKVSHCPNGITAASGYWLIIVDCKRCWHRM